MIIPLDIYEKLIVTKFVPDTTRVLRALRYFPLDETKVIIIGQDPYNKRQDACGLAFSVEHDKYPPSLKNIFKELKADLGYEIPKTGNLEPWAKEGVLLLNSILTTEEGRSLAHKYLGWQAYTNKILQKTIDLKKPLVIIAWGREAQKVVSGLKLHGKILVLKGNHPSPLNRSGGFFGKKYFSRANTFLRNHNRKIVDWKL